MNNAAEYDVTIIGAGIAGMVAAVTANGLGKKVAIIEKRGFGGNCSSFTCLPSKTLIRAGHIAKLFSQLENYGLRADQPIVLNTLNLISHIQTLVSQVNVKDAATTFEKIGIRTYAGPAEFSDGHSLMVKGQSISSRSFIIATGTRPMIPPIPGLQDIPFLTNETLYNLEKLPESMLILGGGVDGLEFASSLGRLGIGVTVVEMSPRLLANDDRELVNRLLDRLQRDGIRIMSSTRAVAFSKEKEHITLTVETTGGRSETLQAESVLLTIGRKADLEGLNLEKAAVKYTPRGISVNAAMQTSAPHIYACGDITGPYQLASTAEYQGILAASNVCLPFKRHTDYSSAAFVIFSDPPLARLGMTEEQSRQKFNDDINVYRFEYRNMRRAMVDGIECGLAKIICNHRGELVGAHILGEAAPEVIHELQLIKGFKIPLHRVQKITHAYPTYAQAIVGRASQLAYLDHMNSNFAVRLFLKIAPGYHNRLAEAKERLAESRDFSLTLDDPSSPNRTRPDVAVESSGPVKTEISAIADNAFLVKLDQELNNPDEQPVMNNCLPRPGGRRSYLFLDFGSVNRINGLGVSMLVKLTVLAAKRNQKVIAVGVNAHYRNVFQLTGLDRIISVYATLEEAFNSVAMSTSGLPAGNNKLSQPQDQSFWARPVTRLVVPQMPPEALNLNMRGLSVVGPVQGFGQLWQKRYRLVIDQAGLTPEAVIRILKQNFPAFQPSYNHFYPSPAGIQPGEVVAIDSATPGGPVSTGVMILYSDDTSFTFITPLGHPESGWVSFSASRSGTKISVQILGLARADDPVYEAAFRTIGSKMQVRIWTHVLNSLATYLGVPADTTVEPTLIDPALHWSQTGNLWYNAQIRTLLYMPLRWLRKPPKKNPIKKV
jgi:pyruvate/2-oxoglutarate dehydrogenase complex dihydrolipoamide dehydrogenase (E3) component/anti-anti-sigma regulatory factor